MKNHQWSYRQQWWHDHPLLQGLLGSTHGLQPYKEEKVRQGIDLVEKQRGKNSQQGRKQGWKENHNATIKLTFDSRDMGGAIHHLFEVLLSTVGKSRGQCLAGELLEVRILSHHLRSCPLLRDQALRDKKLKLLRLIPFLRPVCNLSCATKLTARGLCIRSSTGCHGRKANVVSDLPLLCLLRMGAK